MDAATRNKGKGKIEMSSIYIKEITFKTPVFTKTGATGDSIEVRVQCFNATTKKGYPFTGMLLGEAIRHPNDEQDFLFGAKLAMTRAVEFLSYSDRKMAWLKFWEKMNRKLFLKMIGEKDEPETGTKGISDEPTTTVK